MSPTYQLLLHFLSLIPFAPILFVISAVGVASSWFFRFRKEGVVAYRTSWPEMQLPWQRSPADTSQPTEGETPAPADPIRLPASVIRVSLVVRNEEEVATGPFRVRVTKTAGRWHAADIVEILRTPHHVVKPTVHYQRGRADDVELLAPGGLPRRSAWSVEVRTSGGDVSFEVWIGDRPVTILARNDVLGLERKPPPPRIGWLDASCVTGAAGASACMVYKAFATHPSVGLEYGWVQWVCIAVVCAVTTLAARYTLPHPAAPVARGYLGWGLPARWPSRLVVTPGPAPGRPFISYARRDGMDWIKEAVAAAEWVGVTPSVDTLSFAGGDDLARAIGSAVGSSDVFILVLTQRALVSKWCLREADEALTLGKRVVVLVCDGTSDREPLYWGDAWDILKRERASPARQLMLAVMEKVHGGREDSPPGPIFFRIRSSADMYAAIVATLSIPVEHVTRAMEPGRA